LLNTDPESRYTIPMIQQHPWFNQVCHRERPGMLGLDSITIDNNILRQLSQFDFDLDYARKCILANKHNHLTTTYYLLANK